MHQFQKPEYFYLLIVVLFIAVVFAYNYIWRKKVVAKYFSKKILSDIIPDFNSNNKIIKWAFAIISLVLITIGLANPQLGTKKERVKGKGVDLMVLLDVSNSMLAQDIQPSRMERSKLMISKLLDHLNNDRVGFIIFAGNAFLQVPLTMDYNAIKMNLSSISPSDIPSQGTDIGSAINLAQESLGLVDNKSKAIIVITDGEDHDEKANTSIENAKKNGIKVISIGVGSDMGATIPMGDDVKRDKNGDPVVTKVNVKMLKELAEIGNGAYFQLGKQSDMVGNIMAHLDDIEKKEFEEFNFTEYISYFYWFLIGGLVMMFLYFIYPEISFRKFSISVLCCLMFTSAFSQNDKKVDVKKIVRKGNVEFQKKNYDKAEVLYRKALAQNPKNAVAKYNLASSLYKQKKESYAIPLFNEAVKSTQDKNLKAKSYHNLGNAHFKAGNMDEAIKAYENSLKLNPSDMDTKFNLALAKKKKKQNKQKKNQKNKDKNKDKDKQNKDKKDDNKKGDKKDDKQNQPKPQPSPQQQSEAQKKREKLNKQQAQRILDALKNQEKKTKLKVQRQKPKKKQELDEKDW